VAEAIGGLLLETPVDGVPEGYDELLQLHQEARTFFINALYPCFRDAWALAASRVQGWQSLYFSMRRAVLTCAASYISGISTCAPGAAGSSPERLGAQLGASHPQCQRPGWPCTDRSHAAVCGECL
jgi:hypothetical protein